MKYYGQISVTFEFNCKEVNHSNYNKAQSLTSTPEKCRSYTILLNSRIRKKLNKTTKLEGLIQLWETNSKTISYKFKNSN